MPVGQDLPELSQSQITNIMMRKGRMAYMTSATYKALQREKVGKDLLGEFDRIYYRPEYCRPFLPVGLKASAPLGVHKIPTNDRQLEIKTRHGHEVLFQGRSPDGAYLYHTMVRPKDLVDIVSDPLVVEIDDFYQFFERQRENALASINKNVVSKEWQAGKCNMQNGIAVIASEPLESLRDNLSWELSLQADRDQDGNIVYLLQGRTNMMDVAYLSHQPHVLEVVGLGAYYKRNELSEEGLPTYTPSQSLSAEFAVRAYGTNAWSRVVDDVYYSFKALIKTADNLYYKYKGRSICEEPAAESLKEIAAKGLMSFVSGVFHHASRGVPVLLDDKQKKSLASHLSLGVPHIAPKHPATLNRHETVAEQMANEIFAQAAEGPPIILTTNSGQETLRISNDAGVLQALRLKIA